MNSEKISTPGTTPLPGIGVEVLSLLHLPFCVLLLGLLPLRGLSDFLIPSALPWLRPGVFPAGELY